MPEPSSEPEPSELSPFLSELSESFSVLSSSFSSPIESDYVGEVNSGTWMKNTIEKECTLPTHILMPFCYFIDGLNIDKYGKLTVEAVLTCCLWFN